VSVLQRRSPSRGFRTWMWIRDLAGLLRREIIGLNLIGRLPSCVPRFAGLRRDRPDRSGRHSEGLGDLRLRTPSRKIHHQERGERCVPDGIRPGGDRPQSCRTRCSGPGVRAARDPRSRPDRWAGGLNPPQPEPPLPAAARKGRGPEGACPVRERMPKAPPACGSGSRDASPPPGQMVGDPAGPCCKQFLSGCLSGC
jgi:hypothetical protein